MLDATHGKDAADERAIVTRALHHIAEADRLFSERSVGAHHQRDRAWFDQLRTTHVGLWLDLERAISGFVRHERALERRPEQVIIVLKKLIDDARLDSELRRQLERDVIRWSIEAYYPA